LNRLEGRIALITGGARGIGRATAEAYVREGTQVRELLLDLDGEERDLASEEPKELASLRALLDAHLAATEETRAARTPAGARPGDPIPLDPEREAKLRALGYVE